MIGCSLGLWALDAVSHDYSSILYIFLALLVMLINPIGKIISLIKWIVTDLSQKPDLPPPHLKTRELSIEEQREQKAAKLEAENKLKLLNASKNWERSHNKEAGVPNK
jgi:hypothetical protein